MTSLTFERRELWGYLQKSYECADDKASVTCKIGPAADALPDFLDSPY